MRTFETINRAYNQVFVPDNLSLGLVIPIENYTVGTQPTMMAHIKKVQLAEELGFKAVWVRDIPLNVPSFGDMGQMFDPFSYLGFLAGHTKEIALCTGSIALPLHHPLHVAKSAATIDQLSDGRLILGIASGDRPAEFPAMNVDFNERGALFRAAYEFIRTAQEDFPKLEDSPFGKLDGRVDILPKAKNHKIPMLVTGHSRQSEDWIAANGDGWMSYPRNIGQQEYAIVRWREKIAATQAYDKPFMQPLYVILTENDDTKPIPIQLGFKIGVNYLVEYLRLLQTIGVNHVGVNLRFQTGSMEKALEKLAKKVLPHFHIKQKINTL